mmetsp:Transcript_34976/g.73384  ORF Transcript_34976/g.73384 Transcript_34976/m.73384 type:complete len:136 (+) Transcript_34976:2363-2770(+)
MNSTKQGRVLGVSSFRFATGFNSLYRTKKNNLQTKTNSLDFGVSEESDSGIVSLFPEVPGRKTKRIVVLDGRVQVAGQCLQIGLRRLQLSGRGRSTGAGEGGGGCGGGKEDGGGGLHGGILVLIRIMTTLWYYLN